MSSAAKYQPIQGDGGLMGQHPLPGSQPVSTQNTPPSFKRFCVANDKDIDKTYALLGKYVKQPELAFTVDDFVADESVNGRSRFRSMCGNIDRRFQQPAIAVQEDVHRTIETYV
jgi:hypothetical protein